MYFVVDNTYPSLEHCSPEDSHLELAGYQTNTTSIRLADPFVFSSQHPHIRQKGDGMPTG